MFLNILIINFFSIKKIYGKIILIILWIILLLGLLTFIYFYHRFWQPHFYNYLLQNLDINLARILNLLFIASIWIFIFCFILDPIFLIKNIKLFFISSKNSENDYENETDYQTELKQSQAEKFIKMYELNNCEYQILLCQKENKFTEKQKQQAIKLLEKQINNLNSALNLLSEIKNIDFNQKDLEKINTKIKNTKIILDEIKNN